MAAVILFAAGPASAIADQGSPGPRNLLQPEHVRSAVQGYIARHAPWGPEQVKIRKINFNHAFEVPAGKLSLHVSAPKHTDWIGAIPFTVNVVVEGQKISRLTVPVNIEVWSDVILTTKPLGKYQPIGPDDIQIKKMNLARTPSNVIVRMDQILGRRTNRNVAANCLLRTDLIELPPVVKRGDIVQVVAESPILKITVKGMVKENGGQGERVKVINLRSKKAIFAQVVDGQTVQVDF